MTVLVFGTRLSPTESTHFTPDYQKNLMICTVTKHKFTNTTKHTK